MPDLIQVGKVELAERLRAEHQQLEALMSQTPTGDHEAARQFAALLVAHVRFEERTLFPACQELLSEEVLGAVSKYLYVGRGEIDWG